MKYPLTFYTNKFEPKDFAGKTFGPLILIRPSHKDDVGLHMHELYHVKQWMVMLLLFTTFPIVSLFYGMSHGMIVISILMLTLGVICHPLMYRFIEDYRLICELESYKIQAHSYDDGVDRIPLFAQYIAKYYGIEITEVQAENMLRG